MDIFPLSLTRPTGITEVITENIRFLACTIKFLYYYYYYYLYIISIIKTVSLLHVSNSIGYLQVFIINVMSSFFFWFILQYSYCIVVLMILVCTLFMVFTFQFIATST